MSDSLLYQLSLITDQEIIFIYSPPATRTKWSPHTLHPTPYTPHPTPYTLHPTPHTPHPTPHFPIPHPPSPIPRLPDPMSLSDPRRQKQLKTLVEKLGLSADVPVRWDLLDLALTHPSVSRDKNYEQLEFVGDSVVRLVAAEVLLETYPEALVGEFAALRSMMVSDRTLAEFADRYGFERYLLVSSSTSIDQAGQISRLADAFEAVLGALYLSTQTMILVRSWLDEPLREKAAEIRRDPARQNYKDALQEWTQATYKKLPQYLVKEINGLDQERFCAEVWLNEQKLGVGTGRSKKAAEQAAAKSAFLEVVKG